MGPEAKGLRRIRRQRVSARRPLLREACREVLGRHRPHCVFVGPQSSPALASFLRTGTTKTQTGGWVLPAALGAAAYAWLDARKHGGWDHVKETIYGQKPFTVSTGGPSNLIVLTHGATHKIDPLSDERLAPDSSGNWALPLFAGTVLGSGALAAYEVWKAKKALAEFKMPQLPSSGSFPVRMRAGIDTDSQRTTELPSSVVSTLKNSLRKAVT